MFNHKSNNYSTFSNRLWLQDVWNTPLCGKYLRVEGFWRRLIWYLRGKPTSMQEYVPGMLDKMRERATTGDFGKNDWIEDGK